MPAWSYLLLLYKVFPKKIKQNEDGGGENQTNAKCTIYTIMENHIHAEETRAAGEEEARAGKQYARRVSIGRRNSRTLLSPSNDSAQVGFSDECSPTNGPISNDKRFQSRR